MANFQRLPAEMSEAILSNLSCRDLAMVSRVSRLMRDAALRPLYRNIELKCLPDPPVGAKRLISLFRTISQNELLARQVRHVTISLARRPATFDEQDGHGKMADEDLELFEKSLVNAKLPMDWMKAIEKYRNSAILAVLLTLCPRLQSLDIHQRFLSGQLFLVKMFTTALTNFRELATIRIDKSEDREVSFRIDALLPFFYLPSLIHLDAPLPRRAYSRDAATGALIYMDWPTSDPPLASTLETLIIPFSRGPIIDLQFIIAQTPNLTTLDCYLTSPYPERLEFEGIVHCLRRVKGTLKNLKFSLQPYDDYVSDAYGKLGTLQDFEVLEKLEIDCALIFGWEVDPGADLADVLPPTLKSVTFRDDYYGIEDYYWEEDQMMVLFRSFLEGGRWKSATPKLESFNLKLLNTRESEWLVHRRTELKALCAEQGLDCYIRKRWQGKSYRPGSVEAIPDDQSDWEVPYNGY